MFAAFKAFDSPVRHKVVPGSCDYGTHRIWWDLEAADAADALSQLPDYVAARTKAIRVRDLRTP